MSIGGLILAAGASSRMGSPKALLEIDGETFLDRLIGAFVPHCAPVVVVLGYHGAVIEQGSRRAREVRFVLNPSAHQGQLNSLKCGLKALPSECAAVMFTPVDYPWVRPSTVATLAGALRASDELVSLVVPTHKGKRGHPVSVRRELIPVFIGLPDDAMARDVIHQNVHRTRYVEVDDPGILHDIDDLESYKQQLASKRPA
jgi:molybdenum cofactor cytidylyltransferase